MGGHFTSCNPFVNCWWFYPQLGGNFANRESSTISIPHLSKRYQKGLKDNIKITHESQEIGAIKRA